MPRTQRPPSVSRAVSKRLVAVIKDLELSLSDVSESLNYKTSATMHSVCAGKALPDISKLLTLAEEHAVNLHWLITGEGERYFRAGRSATAFQSKIDVDIINRALELPEAKKRALLVLLESQ